MPYTFLKALFGTLLFLTLLFSSARDRQSSPRPTNPPDQSRTGSAKSLPAGMERSDWQGILAAHEEWMHSIQPAEKDQHRWEAANTGTGLRASFDTRGGEVSPESGDWQWGLELLSYGVGAELTASRLMAYLMVMNRRIQ